MIIFHFFSVFSKKKQNHVCLYRIDSSSITNFIKKTIKKADEDFQRKKKASFFFITMEKNQLEYDEAELFKDLGPKASQFVRMRIQQEIKTIHKQRDRVIQAMKEDILHMKQRLLYDVCAKMQNLAYSDSQNIELYKEKCPDLFTRFVQKSSKKRMRKKPKLQKPNTQIKSLNQCLDPATILNDIACIKKAEVNEEDCENEFAQMTTRGGQKWIVQKIPIDETTYKIKYCDGTSSSLTRSDIETLKLQFKPVNK